MGSLARAARWAFPLHCAAALAIGGEAITIDEKAGAVRVPAVVAQQGAYKELKGAIEYVLVSKGGKAYETIFVTDVPAIEIYEALLKIGLKPGEPAKEGAPPAGPAVRIFAEFTLGGKKVQRAIDELVTHAKTGKPLAAGLWVFTGSTKAFDPGTNKDALQATITRSIVGLHFSDSSPLFQNPRTEARQENIYRANAKELPEAGTAAQIVLERLVPKLAAGAHRVHAFISGRVQGVGFRAFTQREARLLKLTGWVKNLPDGRVEAVIEGPQQEVNALLEKVRRGPRAARVDKLDAKDEPAQGDFESFEIRF